MLHATAFATTTTSAASRGAMVTATAFVATTASATSRGAMITASDSTAAAVTKHLRSSAGSAAVLVRFMPSHQGGEWTDVSQRAGRQAEAQYHGHRNFASGPGATGSEETRDLPPVDTKVDQRQSDGDEAKSRAQSFPGILADP